MKSLNPGRLFLVAFGALTFACQKHPNQSEKAEPESASPALSAAMPEVVLPAPGANQPGQTERVKVAVEWDDPAGWTRLARTSPMRAATYKLPAAQGDSEQPELGVFYFGPGQGGSVDSNVERWAKQFDKTLSDVERQNREVNGLKQHVVEIKKGDFSAGLMGQAGDKKANYAMLGAIVEAPSGSYFFKLTGPQKSVAAGRDQFFALLDSVKTHQ